MVMSMGGYRGGRAGGGGSLLSGHSPFEGPKNVIKRERMLCVCARMHPISVNNSYPDASPLSEILFPPNVKRKRRKYVDNGLDLLSYWFNIFRLFRILVKIKISIEWRSSAPHFNNIHEKLHIGQG